MIDDPLAPFRWLCRDDHWWSEIFCVSFLRGVEPAEVVRRFGGTATGRHAEFDEFEDLVSHFLHTTDGGEGSGHVGAVEVGEWCVAIEPSGWSAVSWEVASRLSRDGAELVAISRHDYAEDTFLHARDGVVLTTFNPDTPGLRHGDAPHALADLMRAVGLAPDQDLDQGLDEGEGEGNGDGDGDGDGWDALAPVAVLRSFALAAKITGVVLEPAHLDGPLYVGAVSDLVRRPV
ncbi:DUF6461 domain-containing protein [Nonomuraea sp. NPDC047897]|uniref:DUF6461 domain-containing protein n=1 Tax=Nonomuraea sp. NPDC047897 TaxID=3364346 RepID=UPI00371E0E96